MKSSLRFVFSLTLLLICRFAISAPATDVMNGYKLSDYPNFIEDWQLVTVRYRQDSGEMRFTYANELAWSYLLKGGKDYPDGAVFAKMSAKTNDDLAFPSSKVPSGKRRIQFMVRNKAKHKTTGGWGYALFSPNGKRFPGDVKAKSMACAACHKLVEDRGQVFSQPMAFLLPKEARSKRKLQKDWRSRVTFREISSDTLPAALRARVASKQVNSLEGPLQQNMFFGTLDEVRPMLIKKTLESGRASLVISSDQSQYSAVYFDKTGVCKVSGQVALISVHTVPNKNNPLIVTKICEVAE